MWNEYVVRTSGGGTAGKHRRKQAALEAAQRLAFATPWKSFTVYRATHYNEMCDLEFIVSYWFDETLQHQEA